MGDVFKEQLVKKESSFKDKAIKAGIVVLAILIVLACFTIQALMPFVFFIIAGLGFLAYYLITRLNREYEYIFTSGELDIDVIYNKSTRKRLFTGGAKDFSVFAHVDDERRKGSFGDAKEYDYSSGIIKDNTYAFLATYKGKKMKIIIEPNEELLKAMTPYLGQRQFLK